MIPSTPNNRNITPYGSSRSTTTGHAYPSDHPLNNANDLAREHSMANEANAAEQMRLKHLKEQMDRGQKERNKSELQEKQRHFDRNVQEIKRLEAEIRRLDSESQRLHKELGDIEMRLSENEQAAKRVKDEILKSGEEILTTERELIGIRKHSDDFSFKLRASEADKERILYTIKNLEAELKNAKRDLDAKNHEIRNINIEIAKKGEEINNVESVIIQKKKVTDQKSLDLHGHSSQKIFRGKDMENKRHAIVEVEHKKQNDQAQLEKIKRENMLIQGELKVLSAKVK